MRSRLMLLLLAVLLLTPGLVFAQNVSVQWNRWDDQITVQQDNSLQIAETQEVQVLNGPVRQGSRYWTDPVQLQAVYLILGNNQPQTLTQGNGNQPGTYTLTQNGGQTTLTYYLTTPQNSGSTFTVQINYTATSPTSGMVDWNVIPSDHAFPIQSSTVRITFPNGQAPDSSLVRVAQGNGTATVNGNQVTIQSQGSIPPQQAFAIQIPYGAGVGAAGNTGNTGNTGGENNPGVVPPQQGNPGGVSTIQLPGCGTLLIILCIVGFILLVAGGGLLRGLLGGGLGSLLGRGRGYGPFGGGSGGPFGGGGSGFGGEPPAEGGQLNRGFRPSSNQDREIGNVRNDKGGGGAGFG